MSRTAIAIPPALARRRNRVLRPRDAGDVYAHPRAELSRLVHSGAMRRVATGYYVLVPQEWIGDDRWRPDLDAAALGLAQTDYGADAVALVDVSAARHHGAIPRALAVSVVAVPKQRPTLDTAYGRVIFVNRDAGRLDLERVDTPLTSGWVTTVEQTLLDIAARPTQGGLAEADAAAAVRALGTRVDWDLVERLAREQHRPGALRAALRMAERDGA